MEHHAVQYEIPKKNSSENESTLIRGYVLTQRAFIKGKRGREEGIQSRKFDPPSTNSQPPEGLSDQDACNNVSRYCQPFHWDHITEADYEAAVSAEQLETGGGPRSGQRCRYEGMAGEIERSQPCITSSYSLLCAALRTGCDTDAEDISHVGEVKQAVSAKDWKRIYDWDLRRMLREVLLAPEPAGGQRGMTAPFKNSRPRVAQNSEETR